MKLKEWILKITSDGYGGAWAVYEINSSGIFRDTFFGPMPVKIPPEVELTEEEQSLHIEGFDECCKWLDSDFTNPGTEV
ncbi:MAG: hypothetical protein M0R80_01040 [Proteobacteria bacterium]|jgi:hypothetical protein|nr:hypothetical protein [Pseudomonadota bacterium]